MKTAYSMPSCIFTLFLYYYNCEGIDNHLRNDIHFGGIMFIDKIRNIIAAITAFFTLLSGFAVELTDIYDKYQSRSVEELIASDYDIFNVTPMSEVVYVISPSGLSAAEMQALVCLQGLAAKAGIGVYQIHRSLDIEYLVYAEEKLGFTESRSDKNGNRWTLWTLLEELKACVDGYVLYKADRNDISLDMACTIAGVDRLLAVEASIESKAKAAGLEKKKDISAEEPDLSLQKAIFKEYKDRLNRSFAVHLENGVRGMRDLAVSEGAFVFFAEESFSGRSFRRSVFRWLDDNSPVLGWALSETGLITDASKEGCFTIPSDHSLNNSFYVRCPEENLTQNDSFEIHTDITKHYVALVMSDGDNAQWIENGFGHFVEKSSRGDCNFPMTWTFSPFQYKLSGISAKYMYSRLSEGDSFIAGPSGAGYINPSNFKTSAFEGFTDFTAYSLCKSDMNIVTILDEYPDNFIKEMKFSRILDYYSRYNNIDGGILQLYPGCYDAGGGKVHFSNDKPFVSVRLSLWHPSGDASQVTDEWLREQAETVNSFAADINSISGYSVINVHPWTVSVDNLKYFVDCLDEDVVLITAQELIAMVEQNVPHESASP